MPTTKYESVSCQLNGATASMTPVSPAHRNWNRNATQNSIGVAKRILPPHIVPSQLKILMPVGTATRNVEVAKKLFAAGVMPTANMWCAHTLKLMKPIAIDAATITG